MSPTDKSPSGKAPPRKRSGSRAPSSRARKSGGASSSGGSSDSKSPDDKVPESTKLSHLTLKRERTPFEWGLLLVALAAIGTIVVGLFLYAGHKAGGEAVLNVEATGKPVNGAPQVEVTVRNIGGSGAEQVITEVTMGEETREVTMTRIAKDDEATAIVSFPPGTTGTPEAELLSYNQP